MDGSVVYSSGGANVPPCNTCFLWPNRVYNPNSISIGSALFGQPFAKRFALCHWTTVLSVLDVMLVYSDQTVKWINMPFRTEVGLGPGHLCYMGTQLHPT